jgi:uncharacterized protein YutE (UPF0331/DUF86 family)
MTDAELIAKKLSEIESYVRDLRALASPEEIESDVKEERFAAHTLQLAIQAALDAASHIVSDERLGEPSTNRELFELLEKHGWLESELAARLRKMAGFRNVLVHGYQKLDRAILVDAVRNRLDDLNRFAAAVPARLPRSN